MTPEERAEKLAWFRSGLSAFPGIHATTIAEVEPYPTFFEVEILLHYPEGQEPKEFGSYRFPRKPMESTESCLAWMIQELELNPHTSDWINNYLSDIEALL